MGYVIVDFRNYDKQSFMRVNFTNKTAMVMDSSLFYHDTEITNISTDESMLVLSEKFKAMGFTVE